MITFRAIAIDNPQVREYISNIDTNEFLYSRPNVDLFLEQYRAWCGEDLNSWHAYITDGVTGAYDNFNAQFPTLETVTLKGEYPYHRSLGAGRIKKTEDLVNGQKLIISDPWAASGDSLDNLQEIYNRCNSQGIPVFLDRAFHGASASELKYDDCVTHIGYSFSKAFYTGRTRTGVCFTRQPADNQPMKVINEYSYVNGIGVGLHSKLMEQFSVDYTYNHYRARQIELCSALGIRASDTVFLGNTYDDKYAGFNREGTVNRICITQLLNNNLDPNEVEWETKS